MPATEPAGGGGAHRPRVEYQEGAIRVVAPTIFGWLPTRWRRRVTIGGFFSPSAQLVRLHNLVVDMRGLAIMRTLMAVVFDATHSVQLPGAGAGRTSGGQPQFIEPLSRAAVAAGCHRCCRGHEAPERALSDGSRTRCRLDLLGAVVAAKLRRVHAAIAGARPVIQQLRDPYTAPKSATGCEDLSLSPGH